ncbi:14689_t:CDS:2 [Ambispora leptoticha]|uniref:14689_t:CDS:1 n=1 Tax=Ambispora leptoticha TaxID=144679 RepID=A0A9N8V8N2_9GLOM|nr:14689_t:CDS:2 [Ambispora leptoticha]
MNYANYYNGAPINQTYCAGIISPKISTLSILNPNITVTISPSTSTSDMGQSSGIQLSIGICFSVTVSLSWITIETIFKFTNNGGGQSGVQLVIYNSGDQPSNNEIFTITPTTPGIFEIYPYINFYHNLVIAQAPNSKIGDNFTLQNRTDSNPQKFTFDCDTCNINTNSQNWTLYHTSCNIKNFDNGYCMNYADYYNSAPINQTYCTAAKKWDLWGIISPENINFLNSKSNPNITVTTYPSTSTSASYIEQSSGVQLSIGGLVGIVVGSCAGMALIILFVGYLFFRHRQSSMGDDRVNLQIYK